MYVFILNQPVVAEAIYDIHGFYYIDRLVESYISSRLTAISLSHIYHFEKSQMPKELESEVIFRES